MKPGNWPDKVPYIDRMVRYVGVSELRKLSGDVLRGLNETVVLQENPGFPLAVLIPWEAYMILQERARRPEAKQ